MFTMTVGRSKEVLEVTSKQKNKGITPNCNILHPYISIFCGCPLLGTGSEYSMPDHPDSLDSAPHQFPSTVLMTHGFSIRCHQVYYLSPIFGLHHLN